MSHQIRKSERGASAVEYGLLAAGVAAVIVAVILIFGGRVHDLFQNTCDTVATGTNQTACN